jgi:hypothetical protein
MTGDLVFAAAEGGTQTVELTTFHVPHKEADRDAFLTMLEKHLAAGSSAAAPSRRNVFRIVGGDGNGVWHPDEATDETLRPIPHLGGGHFKGTHGTGPWLGTRTRLDYIFANRYIQRYVSHTDPIKGEACALYQEHPLLDRGEATTLRDGGHYTPATQPGHIQAPPPPHKPGQQG